MAVLMEVAPPGIQVASVQAAIRQVDGVSAVHDLHVWSIGTGKNALACHLEVGRVSTLEDSQAVLRAAEGAVAPLGITHVTIQVEMPEQPKDHTPW